ncbi:sulfurtransferase [Geitlerinema splendidum]|nr:sulfurtransferase [Geitlerinema splendidum]
MNTPLIVAPQWVADRLEDPEIIIIDCRFALNDPQLGRQQYLASHLPGAYYLDLNRDLSSPVQQHGGRHPLPDRGELARKLEGLGIKFNQTQVVVYDDSRMAFAARLWWLLRHLGHDRVSVLDGGFSAWQTAGYPVSEEVPEPRLGGSFTPQVQADAVVDIEAVKARKDLPGVVLIDSRERDRYLGEREPIDPVAGHIPGAINYPWQEVTDDRGFVKSQEAQRQRWQDIEPDRELIVYCGSGVTACVNLLSLELAGIQGSKLYAGSWSDWCSYA